MKLTKEERSWILYDVANSAFILIITATLPIYFRSLAEGSGVSANLVTAWWGSATSVSLFLLALVSPLLGAIADYKGYKKKLFFTALMLGILSSLTFIIVDTWQAFLFLYVVARVGYSAANVFYDGMLVDVTTNDRMDHVSSMGYAMGYIGSTIPFIAGLALIFLNEQLGISLTLATQLSFAIIIIWWFVLSIPLLRNVKQRYYLDHQPQIVKTSFKRVIQTFKDISNTPKIKYFILAYFFYIDGVYTIISMATSFGGEVGIDETAMLLALLLTQFVAFPFAILAGKLAKKVGSLKIIKICIGIYTFVAIFGFFLAHEWQFWMLAIIIGMAQGGVQSLSRSYFGQMIPKEKANEYFGFFDIFGKFADFMGPLLITISSVVFGQSKYGILLLVVLFGIGFMFLNKIEETA